MEEQNLIQFEIPDIDSYTELYNKLLYLLVDYGLSALKDCKSTCDSKNAKIIDCWNVFQSACAAYILGELNKAEVLRKYVDGEVELLYGEFTPEPSGDIYATNEDIDNLF